MIYGSKRDLIIQSESGIGYFDDSQALNSFDRRRTISRIVNPSGLDRQNSAASGVSRVLTTFFAALFCV